MSSRDVVLPLSGGGTDTRNGALVRARSSLARGVSARVFEKGRFAFPSLSPSGAIESLLAAGAVLFEAAGGVLAAGATLAGFGVTLVGFASTGCEGRTDARIPSGGVGIDESIVLPLGGTTAGAGIPISVAW